MKYPTGHYGTSHSKLHNNTKRIIVAIIIMIVIVIMMITKLTERIMILIQINCRWPCPAGSF